MHSLPDYAILIVTFNNEREIPLILGDLARQDPPPRTTLVVDNASSDSTLAEIATQFPTVALRRNPTNLGLSKAINLGFSQVEEEFVLLLNPDLRIDDSCFANKLIACLQENPRAAAVGPLQYKQAAHGTYLNFTWSFISPRTFPFYFLSAFGKWPASRQNPVQVSFLNFGCLMLNKSAFEAAGGMNEDYFLYGEEPDLFLKFKRLHYTALLNPEARSVHYRERSLRYFSAERRLWLKFRGIFNILHALVSGYMGILQDKWDLGNSSRV